MNNFFINITQVLKKNKKTINTTEKFSFCDMEDDEVRKFIVNLEGSKATPVGHIPTDMLKQTIDIHLPIMTQIINMSIANNCYLDDLKLAEVSLVF